MNDLFPLEPESCCNKPQIVGEADIDTIYQRFKRRQSRLQIELEAVNAAIEAMEKNPVFIEFLDTLRKAARF